jgi:hypothetical protein
MDKRDIRRDFGATWKERLAEALERAVAPGPRLSGEDIANLRSAVADLDVSSPEDMALLWSGRDILTAIPLDGDNPTSPRWWDKLACHEAEVFAKLGLSCRLEDTPGGQFLLSARLTYPEDDPLSSIARELWEVLSIRFVSAVTGHIEIIAEGAFTEGVFRAVEFDALLSNERITAINGLDRSLFSSDVGEAFALLRRWDVERSHRYYEFIAAATDATPHERATALDDFREIQLWYEQDFFEQLGPQREPPPLPVDVVRASDRSMAANAWKYSALWRAFIITT